jgi:hypothetical protein
MPRKIWIKKSDSFSEEYNNDLDYYLNMSSDERVELVQFLREQHLKINGMNSYESGKGLRRTINIIQQV